MEKFDTGETRISRPTAPDGPRISLPPKSSSIDDIIGRVISDRFRVTEKIGSGGMSTVFKADDLVLKRSVAVKMLDTANSASNAASIQRFHREAKTLSTLDHRNIVKVYSFGISPHGYCYLVMDYLPANNLSEHIKQTGSLPPQVALNLFKQLCEGLVHVHEHGVIHRDIKPANVIILSEGAALRPVLVDFGIAFFDQSADSGQGRITDRGSVCGSPPYMSPEQCLGTDVDFRSDIYSLGCLFYEVITGHPPFSGAAPAELMLKHVNDDPSRFDAILAAANYPSSIESVILKCLAKKPEERYASARDLLYDLNEVGSGSDRESTLEMQLEPKRKPALSKRLLIATALGIVATTLAAAFLIYNSPDNQTKRLEQDATTLLAAPAADFSKLQKDVVSIATKLETAGEKVAGVQLMKSLEKRAGKELAPNSREYAEFWIAQAQWLQQAGHDEAAKKAGKAGIDAMYQHAMFNRSIGDYRAERTALLDCISYCESTRQPKDAAIPFLYSLSTRYKGGKNYRLAEEPAMQILELSLSMPESNRKPTAIMMARFHLAEIYICQRRFQEALPLFESNEQMARKLFGKNSTNHKETVKSLANCHQQLGHQDVAQSLLQSIQ